MPRAIEDINVSDDHLLLQEILEGHGLTAKWLIGKTGRSSSQVYRYLGGEATIPSVVWRVLYERTRDERIGRLFTGDVPVVTVGLKIEHSGADAATSIKQLCAARKQQLTFEETLLDILADGVINERDRKYIAKLKAEFPKMISLQTQIYSAVTGEYQKAGNAGI